jgi:hypothetical protein
MPVSSPAKAEMFNEEYPIIGRYITDDDRIPYFNPADSGLTVLPGTPLLITRGGNSLVYMAQGPISPGETGFIVRRFTADFPCDLSADVEQGTEIFWDPLDDTASPAGTAALEGDTAGGFRIGTASYAYDGHKTPTLGSNDLPLCGTTASTLIRVVSMDGAAELKAYPTTVAPTTTT